MSAPAAPYFDDLSVGDRVDDAPALTLTDGHAAVHAAIVGDRLRLAADRTLAERVLGSADPLAHPSLVCDVAIGQSTLITTRVIANLFYRGLVLRRAPLIGDTLRTTTEVVGLRQNAPRDGRPATGMAALRIVTVDQHDRPVLDFWRCAMLPLRDPEAQTGYADDLEAVTGELSPQAVLDAVPEWRLDAFREAAPGAHFADIAAGRRLPVAGGDVVSNAPELARMSLNVALAHHDAADGRRLVYGGHTIGVAAAQATRALPNLVTIIAWHGCDHLGPVFEGDTLHSELDVERAEPLTAGGGLVHLRSRVQAAREDGPTPVLDWRFVGLMA